MRGDCVLHRAVQAGAKHFAAKPPAFHKVFLLQVGGFLRGHEQGKAVDDLHMPPFGVVLARSACCHSWRQAIRKDVFHFALRPAHRTGLLAFATGEEEHRQSECGCELQR